MVEIRREEDLTNYKQIDISQVLILPDEVRAGINSIIKDYYNVGWGYRIFRNLIGDYAIVPCADKWIQGDGLGDLQVIQFHFDTDN